MLLSDLKRGDRFEWEGTTYFIDTVIHDERYVGPEYECTYFCPYEKADMVVCFDDDDRDFYVTKLEDPWKKKTSAGGAQSSGTTST